MQNTDQNDSHDFQQDMDDHDVIYALRTVHQNQTQLVVLADQKANILIGIVAVVFTILFTKTHFLTNIHERLLIPFVCFLLMEVLAAFLALFVILPKKIVRPESMKIEDVSNPLFFGIFTKFKQDEYVTFLSDKLIDNQSARVLLITDIYQQGGVLKRKYSLLRYAYTVAAIGVASLLSFIVLFLFTA